jgi:thymidine phosphorylase
MEVLANVELSPIDVRRCLEEARACIAWNGRLNHSVVDDVMNAITRPLGIDSNRWSVASILSKKLTAGSTHIIVDLPFGPRAKLKTEADAIELAALFENVGRGLGLAVQAFATDGSKPIGRGIGPALEARDVSWVLDNHPEAPADLVEKALFFASRILAWDSSIGSVEAGRYRAEELLRSGAARKAFDRIIDVQGRRLPRATPGLLIHTVHADRAGTVKEIDGCGGGNCATRWRAVRQGVRSRSPATCRRQRRTGRATIGDSCQHAKRSRRGKAARWEQPMLRHWLALVS